MEQTPTLTGKSWGEIGILRLRPSSASLHSGYAQDDRTCSPLSCRRVTLGLGDSFLEGYWRVAPDLYRQDNC